MKAPPSVPDADSDPDSDESTTDFLRRTPDGNTEFLLGKAKAGSQAAWFELYRRYRRMLLVLIQSRIPGFARRRVDAEDVLQIAFSKAWQQIQSFEFRNEGGFRAYLRKLMLNEFRNQLRSQDREREHVTTESQAGDLALREDGEARTLADKELSEGALLEAMGKLDDADHELVTMRVFEGLGFEETGRIRGCGREKAKADYERALARLQRLLE